MDYRVTSATVEQTREWGKRLGARLRGGDVVALSGDLGAGKTAFAQGVGESLGVKGPMTSPTFTFQQEYSGRVLNLGMGIRNQTETEIRLIHMDLYRLQRSEEVEVIGVEDAFVEEAICLIEWPEIAEDFLPESRLDVQIIGSGEASREIIFHAREHNWEQRLKDLNI